MLNPYYQQQRDQSAPSNPFAPRTYNLGITQDPALPEDNYNLGIQDAPQDNVNQQTQGTSAQPSPNMDPKEAFYRDMQKQLMERAQRGASQGSQNMVTRQDIDAQRGMSNLNNFAAALSGAADKVGNFQGKMAQNDTQAFADRLNKTGQDTLTERNQAYNTANQDVLGGLEGVKGVSEAQQQQVDFRNKARLMDPNSNESQYARQFAKEAFGKDVPPDTTAAQMQQFIPLMEKKYAIDEQTQAKKDAAQMRADSMRDASLTRADANKSRQQELQMRQDEKIGQTIGESLDPTKGRAGQFGEYAKKVDNAGAIQKLIRDKNGVLQNLDARQMQELAIATNRMLGGSEAASSIAHLVPHTIAGDTNKVVEWLTNNPTGTDQQKFVERMAETVDREQEYWGSKIKSTQIGRLHHFDSYLERNPEKLQAVLDQNGITMDEYKNYKGGIQSPPHSGESGSAPNRQVLSHGADLP